MNWIRYGSIACLLLASVTITLVAEEVEEHTTYQEPTLEEGDRDHWAFHPIAKVAPPEVASSWQRNEIDAFIEAGLVKKDLKPQPAADPETLIRRLSFDLTGLPPTVEQREKFIQAADGQAYEELVDELLDSPHYGERWALHWLDLARFAETDGFEHDKVRPDAWKYRDWVIEAFNNDLPYDEFLRQQIAGDEVLPGNEQALIATRFSLSGPDMPDINRIEERQHTVLNEMTSTVGEVVLGLQLGCAQCHDHKYDPISQADFYRLRAVFEPALKLKKNKSLSVFEETFPYKNQSHVMIRGSFERPGPVVEPGTIRVLGAVDPQLEASESEKTAGLRTALVDWLVSDKNPLTARVIVNRVWQHHFGKGLVATPSDFGVIGDYPTHPELLDWLATYLREHDWSLKQLHRLIVTSATYRQRSMLPGNANKVEQAEWQQLIEADPNNRSWGRYTRWRLEGEAIRDAMLSAAGRLNMKAGGPGVRPPLPPELLETLLKNQWPVTADVSEHDRRSIYLFARRNLRYPIFDVFDRPSANSSCPERPISTTAPQSLHLLNSDFSWSIAQAMAEDLIEQHAERNAQIEQAFLRAFGRQPSLEESQDIQSFWAEQANQKNSDQRILAHYCLVLFNCNEFLYVD